MVSRPWSLVSWGRCGSSFSSLESPCTSPALPPAFSLVPYGQGGIFSKSEADSGREMDEVLSLSPQGQEFCISPYLSPG